MSGRGLSGLSYLCNYGSESDNSDSGEAEINKPKLPAPDLSRVPVVLFETHADDPELHGGRTRAFPHVRGNWATFVYVKYTAEEGLLKLIEKLEVKLLINGNLWQRCDNIHISVSKTVVLNYHLITPFTTSLQKTVGELESFELGFSGVKVYCNEDNSRTFIALQADFFSQKYLLELTKKVDEVLLDFKLPTFYEVPSFHMSIFWINGNYKSEANSILEDLNKIVNFEIDKSLKTCLVDKINCKSGNKYFQYNLS